MNAEVFREYDVRGLVGRDLSEDFVYHLGLAIGAYGRRHNVGIMTLGRDCRLLECAPPPCSTIPSGTMRLMGASW